MNRFFTQLTADELNQVEDPPGLKIAKASWGSQGAPNVADSETGSFDAFNVDCSTEREQSTSTALNDEDFSEDFDDDTALKSCAPAADDDEATRAIKLSKNHLVQAHALIRYGDRPAARRAVNRAYRHLDRYHRAMKAAGQED